ncbi:MAG TPA: DoxX family membrane protein [Proteobacteria bacterium]|nr:DoxX family membrane protein [Pseudomonadota bacterium]
MKRAGSVLFNRWLVLALRLFLGALFIYASIHKIESPDRFLLAVINYRFLPEFVARPFAAVLPWLELFCGLGLITGALLRGASLITSLLYLSFVVALAQALARGLDISCGCFSANGVESIHIWTFVRDVALFAASVWVFVASVLSPSPERER